MIEASFESLVTNIALALKEVDGGPLPLEASCSLVQQKEPERSVVLSALVRSDALTCPMLTTLALFDMVAAACTVALSKQEKGNEGSSCVTEIIDLWTRATAGRTLWFERYVRWPKENSDKKVIALNLTAQEVGGNAVALAVRMGLQPVKLIAFVANLPRAN